MKKNKKNEEQNDILEEEQKQENSTEDELDNFKKRVEDNKNIIEEMQKAYSDQNSQGKGPKLIFKMPKQTFMNFILTLLISVVIDYILFISITGYKLWLEVEPTDKFFLYFTIFTISFSVLDTTFRNLILRFFPKLLIMSGGMINILITILVFIGCSFIPGITLVSHWDVILIIIFLLIARSIINFYINKKIILTIVKKGKKK